MEHNPRKTKTPAELETERKKREAARWNKIILYYMHLMYQAEKERQEEKYRPKLLVEQLAVFLRERRQRTLQKLAEKRPGELSALELLQRMDIFQEEDSPFRGLMNDIRESPDSEEKLARAVDRIVEEAPGRILSRRSSLRARGQSLSGAGEPQPDAEQAEREEQRLFYEMAFLRAVMPPEKYQQLFRALVQQGRIMPGGPELKELPEEKQSGMSYESFVAANIVLPREREGKLGNLDALYSSAAYLLAAYEQRDKPLFDAKAAEVRAMEISGSRAFRLYVGQHPGSLVAAAQNTGLEATSADLAELDRALRERDAVLRSARDALRSRASGKTAAYHRMMNALERFVTAADEPEKKEKDALARTLAQYVMTEGDPKSPAFEREAGVQAAAALRALVPEKEFQRFLDAANAQRGPEEQITQRMLDARGARQAEPAPEKSGPAKVLPPR